MASSEILCSYIKKLYHPLKEIRERALQLLLAKVQLGWELEDELAGTRELLKAFLIWFHDDQPSLQEEALYLLLTILKSQAGAYIAQEYGIKELLAKINSFRHKIDPKAKELHDDVLDMLRFLNTVQSQEDVSVPQLEIPSGTTSETDASSTTGYYKIDTNVQTSRETSVSNSEIEIRKLDDMETTEGIRLLLFPWVALCTSDTKTMLLIENALRVLKSTRRCCRFIRDVFLRDFPAEIFLNRPNIVQNLLAVVGGTNTGKLAEPLHVLLCITKELRVRMEQLSCLDLIDDTEKIFDLSKDTDDEVNLNLEQLASEAGFRSPCLQTDGFEPLRQLPAPIFALDALQAILSTMARSVVLMDPGESLEVLDLHELNICLALVEQLIHLLLSCVGDTFWSVDHKTKTHRDIAHKSCMVMRLLGDLLNKYRTSYLEDPERKQHRVAWIRLVSCSEYLLSWSAESALSLKSLVEPLKLAQLDQALQLFFPEMAGRVDDVMENKNLPIDREYRSKHKELKKLFESMTEAVTFMKNKENCRESKNVLRCIKKSLAILDLHLNEGFLKDIGDVVFGKVKGWEMNDTDWSEARSICLVLMAHSSEQVRGVFYGMLAAMVKSCLVGEDDHQVDNEKCLNLLCDVGVLTEICCHGLCDSSKEASTASSDIMLYLLRGRLVLSERCWWRLLASCLPILPLLHVHVAPDTLLGQAISKSLEAEIADCMGVPKAEILLGQVRLLFVRCPPVQMDAAHALCHILDDTKYLPPKETLRADVLIGALRRVQPQDFNVDITKYSSKPVQTTGLSQILDVLKQDLSLESEQETRSSRPPALEPSLRRAALQQLAVLLRDPALHDAFLQCEGIAIVVTTLRMSLLTEDYLAFPECALSCVSALNSVCFGSRHALAKIADLPAFLLRVVLIFPANEPAVLMAAQVLAVLAWAGFALQELDEDRRRVVSLPASVVKRTNLPFECFSYWNTSPNATHSAVEWLQTSEEWRTAIRTRWSHAWSPALRAAPPPAPPPGPLALRLSREEQTLLRATCPMNSCGMLLTGLQGASSHRDVHRAIALLEGYTYLLAASSARSQAPSLPWAGTLAHFLAAPPASPRDVALLAALLRLLAAYMDCLPDEGGAMEWIKASFFDDNNSIIALLSRDQLFPQPSAQDHIDVTQLHILIVKVVLRCVVTMDDERSKVKLESLLKIVLCCLSGIDLKNFHVLGYLNELTRCARYILYTPNQFSEETLLESLQILARILKGIALGGGRKGQRCRLDALLAILGVLSQLAEADVPVQRWSEHLNGEVIKAIVACARAPRGELRAASLHVAAALSRHASMLPQLLHAIEGESLSQYASGIFSQRSEASVVRVAAASLLTSLTARATPHSDVLECDVLQQLSENNFIEHCIEILVEFCKEKDYKRCFEPNIPLSVLESRSQLEVRAQKYHQVEVLPSFRTPHRPPTAGLVVGLADVIHNVLAFKNCPVQAWNEMGLFRLMFKCTSWSSGAPSEVPRVRASLCRALARAAAGRPARAALAAARDCQHGLIASLAPLDDESDSSTVSAHTQSLVLLSTLLMEKSCSDTVWREIEDRFAEPFFHLLLQCLEFKNSELQEAGMYCLTQLTQSPNYKQSPATTEVSRIDFLDNLKSPYFERVSISSGDGDCQPEFLVEELCKALMGQYRSIALDKQKYQCETDDPWSRTCACLASLLAGSARARRHGALRGLPRALLAALQGLKDHLALAGKAADILRSADNNPVLRALSWLLTLCTSLMTDCLPAKDAFAELGLAPALARLWPWSQASEALREVTLRLLVAYSNDCRKAWSSLAVCVGARSVVLELGALCGREAALLARGRPERALAAGLRALALAARDQHARATIIKTGALNCVYKIRVAERSRRGLRAAAAWARLAETLARYPDGAASLIELRSVLVSPGTRGLIMPAVAHIAHFHRTAFLQSAELVELVLGALLAGGAAEAASAARAAWALAANNHKAKLALRSAGVSSAVSSALERLQRARPQQDDAAELALQLLAYTNTVLQAT